MNTQDTMTSPDEAVIPLLQDGWNHLCSQRPLAAWASWQQVLRRDPENQAANEALEHLARSTTLPEVARITHHFRPPLDPEQRARWDQAFRGRDLAELHRAEEVFRYLAQSDCQDSSARFNQALCLAWMGRNAEAVETLEQVVEIDAQDRYPAAVESWSLAEILRHGAGAESLADDQSFAGSIPWPADRGDPQSLVPPNCLRSVHVGGSASEGPTAVEPLLAGPSPFEWLSRPMPEPSESLSLRDIPRVYASLVVRDARLRYATPDRLLLVSFLISADASGPELLAPGAGFGEIAEESGQENWDRHRSVLPLGLLDAAIFSFRLPPDLVPESRNRLTREAIAQAYENRWIHERRKGLGFTVEPPGDHERPLSPLEAAQLALKGDAVSRVKLEAVIRVREQLSKRLGHGELYASYSFDRLRRRLGLQVLDPGMTSESDFACMSLKELAALNPATLTVEELKEVYMSARGLHADPSLLLRFARPLLDQQEESLVQVDPLYMLNLLTGDAYASGGAAAASRLLDRATALDKQLQTGKLRVELDAMRQEYQAMN